MTDNPDPSGNPQPGQPRHAAPQQYPNPYQQAPQQQAPYQQGPYQQGPYPGGYPPPPPISYQGSYPGYGPPATGPRNGLGVAALVVAIIALVSSFSVVGGILLGIVAVILGFAGRGRVKKGEANNGGVAMAGIILGAVSIVIGLAFIPIYVQVFKDSGAGDYFDCMNKAGQNRSAQAHCEDEFRQSVENKFSVTITPTP